MNFSQKVTIFLRNSEILNSLENLGSSASKLRQNVSPQKQPPTEKKYNMFDGTKHFAVQIGDNWQKILQLYVTSTSTTQWLQQRESTIPWSVFLSSVDDFPFFEANAGWSLRDFQCWSALIRKFFNSDSSLFVTWISMNSADSALDTALNRVAFRRI